MQTIAPPKISTDTIAAFFASMRLWLLEAMAPFLLYLSDRTSNGREIRAWLDAEVRDALDETKRMLFVMAVSRMAPKRVYATRHGGARPCTTHKGFRLAPPRSRKWFRLTTRALKAHGRGLHGRLALLRDLVARPQHWAARIRARLERLQRSRKGARFLCVAPPALVVVSNAPRRRRHARTPRSAPALAFSRRNETGCRRALPAVADPRAFLPLSRA